MTKISRSPLDDKRMSYFLNNFWILLTLLASKEEIKNFLKELLTPTEQVMFAKRLQIAKMLLQGYKYEDIKRFVNVTDNPITTMNNIINSNRECFIKTVNMLIEFENKKEKEEEQNYKKFTLQRIPGYVLPERLLESVEKNMQSYQRKQSAKK